MVREYPSFIAGLRYRGRARYCARRLSVGDRLVLREEPDNPVDPDGAVTIAPANAPSRVIGYVPREHHWVHEALDEGKAVDAVVKTIECDGWLFFRKAWRIWIGLSIMSQSSRTGARLRRMPPLAKPLRSGVVANKPKTADPIYLTPQHRAWREAVLARADRRCEAVDHGIRCAKAEPEHRMFADHIIEVADDGDRFDARNGQCLCGSHHTIKTMRERARRAGILPDAGRG